MLANIPIKEKRKDCETSLNFTGQIINITDELGNAGAEQFCKAWQFAIRQTGKLLDKPCCITG